MRDSLAAGKLEKGTEKVPNVKTGGGEMLISRISQPPEAFLTARNEISLLKEIYFLPQRRKFLAAKRFSGGWKTGKNGGFGRDFPSIWRLSAYKILLAFCPSSAGMADAPPHVVRARPCPDCQNGSGRRESVSSCTFATPRESRVSVRSPSLFRPCDSRVSAFDNLTKCHHKPSLVICTRSISPFFL